MNDSDLVTKRLDDMTVKKTLQPWRPQAARHGRPPSANGTAAADAAAIVPGVRHSPGFPCAPGSRISSVARKCLTLRTLCWPGAWSHQ
jgi:hypothetical protein